MGKGNDTKRPKVGAQLPAAGSPRVAAVPQGGKTPRIKEDPTQYNGSLLAWHLGAVDHGGPYCPTKMDGVDLPSVIGKLKSFESMTWAEVLQTTQNHTISVGRLSKAARQRLSDLKLDDAEEVVSLRLTGACRVFGIRYGPVLRLMWWDPNHEVCPSTR